MSSQFKIYFIFLMRVSYLPILIMPEIMTEVIYYFEALAKFETFTERQTKKNY
jgi:hypothetical protein